MVRFDKIATIDKTIISGRVGSVDRDWLAQHRNVFFAVFGFGDPDK
jgi:mRNA interferase MazF